METLNQLFEELRNWETGGLLLRLAQFIFWVAIVLFLLWLARKGINSSITDNTTRYRARKIIRLIGVILILLLVIISFTGELRYFTIAIGILSAGIAFALQEVILSLAGWIAIFSAKMYQPGDRIELNGVKGDVIDIGITRTTLMEIGEWVGSDNYSGRIVQVSNGAVFKGPVRNYSTDFPFVWDEINLPVKFGSDLKLADTLIQDIARQRLLSYARYADEHWKQMVGKYLIENANVEPTLTFKLTDNWVEFNLRYVVDFKKRRSTRHQLFSEIYDALLATDGRVSLASETFELSGMPELKVNLTKQES
jgi:small-conductance mechanosensitive channel